MEIDRKDAEMGRGGARGAFGKRWVKIVVGIIIAVLIIIFVVPFFVNADTFRPTVENQISSALGRKTTLGHLSFSLWSGSLVADNVSIADDPAFSKGPFLQAKSVHIGVAVGALLFHHQVHITNLRVDSPRIQLISGSNGQWNYSSLGRSGSSSSNSQSGSPNIAIGELKISNGQVTVSSQPPHGKPFVYSNVNLTVHHLSLATPMQFELTASLPGDGSLKLAGTAGPVSQQNTMNTPLRASLEVKHFDPVATGAVTPSEGISMVADIHAQVMSDGKTMKTTGQVKAEHLKLSPNGSPAPNPVNVDFAMNSDLGARTGQVSDIAIHTGSVAAHVTGTYRMAGQAVVLDLHLSAPGLPVDGVEELLPAVGVRLPSGSSLHGGTITASLAITGPAAAPRITGPVEIDNTQLAGFDLGSKIQGLTSFGHGSGGSGTAIRTVKANVDSTSQATQLTNIYGDVPSVGTATGNGTVAASGALDFKLVAKLNSSSAAGKLVGAVGGVAGQFLHTAESNGIPLTITGTTSNPSIRADVGAMLKPGAGGKLGGLLGKNSGNSTTTTKSKAAGLVKGLLGR